MADAVTNIPLTTTSSRHLTDEQKVKLQKATREFESIFVQMVLKSMRSAQGEEANEFGGESYGGDVMKGMFDTELSKHIGGQGKLGIADSLYRKLTGEPLPGIRASSAVSPKITAKGHASRAQGADTVQGAAAAAARQIQQLGELADDSSSETDGDSSPFSLNAAMERLQDISAHAAASANGAGTPTPAWTSSTIEARSTPLPPTPQTTRPAKAALTASAGIAPEPSRRDVSAAAGGGFGKGTNAAVDRVKSYDAIIARTADTVGVDANLLKAMIVEESGARHNARSPKNAKGLMQLIDTTAESMGVKNVWDPHQNIQGGARYLKQQLEKFNGDVPLALASYNAGPGNVERYNGIPPFRETQNYVKRVMKMFTAFQSMEKKSDDVIK
jgi:soluble lytic murein transglycosylase-like protein